MARDLRVPQRTPQDNARLAAVTSDDIARARQQLRRDGERLARILDAQADGDPGDRENGED